MKGLKKLSKRIGVGILSAILLAGYIPAVPAMAAEPAYGNIEESDEITAPSEEDGQLAEDGSTKGNGSIEDKNTSEETGSDSIDKKISSEENNPSEGKDPSESGGPTEENGAADENDSADDGTSKDTDDSQKGEKGDDQKEESPSDENASKEEDEEASQDPGNEESCTGSEQETKLSASAQSAETVNADSLKLISLTSSSQGFNEIVLDFTASPNCINATETGNVYYEVKVVGIPDKTGFLPRGIGEEPKYFYIPKKSDSNTQSKSIEVNYGFLPESTAGTYEFSVRLVSINKSISVPGEREINFKPLPAELCGNTITKRFSTKDPYYEDNLGFTKKNTSLCSGQKDVLVGRAKYSKKGSYLHDLTAVVCDKYGKVDSGFTCRIRNDNDELYISAERTVMPGTYTVVVYSGTGEYANQNNPQGGTMYQSNTSFNITVKQGIDVIDSSKLTKKVAVGIKDSVFSAVPEGYGYNGIKASTQKFTYEIKCAEPSDAESAVDGFILSEPSGKVKSNIKVDSNGKVTVKRKFTVEEDESRNYFAVVVKAADYKGNDVSKAIYFQAVSTGVIPAKIYLAGADGRDLGSKVSADRAHEAKVVVLDEYGKDITQFVTITPKDNSSKTAAAYVDHSFGKETATFYVRKPGTYMLKATTKDGGNRSVSLKVNVTYPDDTQGRYKVVDITCDGCDCPDYTNRNGKVNYRAPKGAVVRIQLGARINGKDFYYNQWFNWGYSIKGGSVKKDGDYWIVKPTGKQCSIEIWKKATPEKGWKIDLINDSWDSGFPDAPKIELMEGTAYVTQYRKTEEEAVGQQLFYQYDAGVFQIMEVISSSKSAPKIVITDFDPGKKTFKVNLDAITDCRAGTYSYKIAFYRLDDKQKKTLACKPATLKIKLNASPKVAVSANYTIDLSKGSSAVLKNTPANFQPVYSPYLLNANVGGKANAFARYFELAYQKDDDGTETAVIRLKGSLTEQQLKEIKGKTMTGYVKYSYVYGEGEIKNATSKVSIKVK